MVVADTTAFELHSPFMSEVWTHELTEKQFHELKNSHNFLLTYMNLEESVLQIMYAMQTFETYLLTGALDYYLFPGRDFDYFQDARLQANLAVSGVLNSISSLRDQFPKFAGMTGDVDARAGFLSKWQELSDSSVTFRFGEHLRNYAQHQNQPVSGATTGGGWDKDRTLMETHLTVYCDVTKVTASRRVGPNDKKVFREVLGTRADLALVLREMTDGVAQLAKFAREMLEPYYVSAISNYEANLTVVGRYSDNDGRHATARAHGASDMTFNIFMDFLARAKRLHRTHVTINAHRHFVSSKARGHSRTQK
jgi:hypothetical protein